MSVECTCFWVDQKYWFTHFGATEPGSQMEWNPDCNAHPPRMPAIDLTSNDLDGNIFS